EVTDSLADHGWTELGFVREPAHGGVGVPGSGIGTFADEVQDLEVCFGKAVILERLPPQGHEVTHAVHRCSERKKVLLHGEPRSPSPTPPRDRDREDTPCRRTCTLWWLVVPPPLPVLGRRWWRSDKVNLMPHAAP